MSNFVDDVMAKSKEKTFVDININNDPVINASLFEQMLSSDIESISDSYLYQVIKASYKDILKGIFERKDTNYLVTFTNPKFLSVLNQVMNTIQIEHDERMAYNKLAYDYLTLSHSDDYIRTLLFTLSKTVNKYYIPGLIGIGLSENLASYLALARFSSHDDIINTKRVNFIIMTTSSNIMTEQRIVDIYSKLFDSVTPLFEGTMFDYLNDEEDWVTDEIELVFSTISLAVLAILNSLPTNMIIKVLESYNIDNQLLHSDEPKRFSLRSISGEYYKIVNAIEFLEQKGIRLP